MAGRNAGRILKDEMEVKVELGVVRCVVGEHLDELVFAWFEVGMVRVTSEVC